MPLSRLAAFDLIQFTADSIILKLPRPTLAVRTLMPAKAGKTQSFVRKFGINPFPALVNHALFKALYKSPGFPFVFFV